MRQKYSIKKPGKNIIATKTPAMFKVKEFLASIIPLNTFVSLLKGVFVSGQWISLEETGKVVFETSPFMGPDKKISKGQIK